MKRTLAALALTALAACTPTYPQGPAGRVVDKRTTTTCRTVGKQQQCSNPRYLTTQDKAGTRTEFRVNAEVYDACARGSHYPNCTERSSR
jgi:hypothetical protein